MTTITSSSLTLQNAKVAAQILAIATSALFAGYTASMSVITVPMMLECFGNPSSPAIASSLECTSTTTENKTTVNTNDPVTAYSHAGDDKDHVSAPKKVGSVSDNRKSVLLNEAEAETLLLFQWRQMYVHGARTARPATAIPVICYLFLLYTCVTKERQQRFVVLWYIVALTGQCGIVLALTVLRRTNGALGIRCSVSSLLA